MISMWGEFALVSLVQLVTIVVPGYLALRACGIGRLNAVALSPIVSIAVLCFLCIVCTAFGISCNWLLIVGPTTAVFAIAYIVGMIIRRRKDANFEGDSKGDWAAYWGYILLGLLMGVFVFLSAIDDPNNFVQRFDNYLHVNAIRGFVESGKMSVFGITPYMTDADMAISPQGVGGFYPAAWYIIAALSLTLVKTSVVVAENALLYVFVCVVFPSGMCVLLNKLGGGDKKFLFYGAFASMAFIAFPWNLLEFGPIYPNAAGLCLFPHVAFVFMEMIDKGISMKRRIAYGLLLVVGVFTCAIIQTNVVFVLIIFLLPFAVSSLYRMGVSDGAQVSKSDKRRRNLVLCAALVGCVCLLWCGLYLTPTFQGMKEFGWVSSMSRNTSLANLMTLKSADAPPQVFLAVVVAAGFAYLLYSKKNRWLLVSYAIMAFMTFLGESVDNVIKFVLDTFCYSDTRRLWAFFALFGMPIAAYGFVGIDEFIRKRITGKFASHAGVGVTACVTIVFCICNFAPQNVLLGQSKPYNDPFDTVREMIAVAAVGEEVGLTPEERVFINEALDVLPDGSLVMNLPTDGSIYAYGVEGIRTYYRVPSSYATVGENDSANTLRLYLREVDCNVDVQNVLRELGIEYLLLLDVGPYADSNYKTYGDDPKLWRGISSINDDTPGFEIVLSDGDMRLYHIIR